MADQCTLPSLVRAISNGEIEKGLTEASMALMESLQCIAQGFLQQAVSPVTTHRFEADLNETVREFARSFLQWCFGALETKEIQDMPGAIKYRSNSYRRMATKTRHDKILTLFGNIQLTRATYRRGRKGKVMSPLEAALGIQWGASPAAQGLVGKQMALAGSSQQRSVEAIESRAGVKIGHEKVRRIVRGLAESMEEHRQDCQLEQLQKWIDEVQSKGEKAVLSVSRDGVCICIAPVGYFEVSAVATLTVFSNGKRMGTVYLATAPEENQTKLSEQLTSLLREVILSHGERLERIAYVSDAGKVETAYWRNVLSRLFVDGVRISIERTLDYYHASLRLTTISECLKLSRTVRERWLKAVRTLLKDDGGWGRAMRSISKMKEVYGIRKCGIAEFNKAVNYLRKHRRFMCYADKQARGLPIGSGIVESACKQIVSERMKLSGMRWKKDGMQDVMTLRSILLSQTWTANFNKSLLRNSPVEIQYECVA
jgi:hypothetical protein